MRNNYVETGLIAGLTLAFFLAGCSNGDDESTDGPKNPAGNGGSGGAGADANADGTMPEAGAAGSGGKPATDSGTTTDGETDSGNGGEAGTAPDGGGGGAAGAGSGGAAGASPEVTIYFTEEFEDAEYKTRGWYESLPKTLSSDSHSGSHSLECTYNKGQPDCSGQGAGRHLFPETDAVYLGYWVKYSSDFVGSGKPYHPHEFYFLTNKDDKYEGPAFTHLTLYLESHWESASAGALWVGFQDGKNIDQSRRGEDLIAETENRAVAGCNGLPSGYSGSCYNAGSGVYVNGVTLASPTVLTPQNKNDWNHVEYFAKLNSISAGRGQPVHPASPARSREQSASPSRRP
ncbi:MAG TPA: hypothetical protein PLJ27_17325, partial [Polyangiaceae bacterium]|nr:hypothetical protein [Polyangiaceae bacterium]